MENKFLSPATYPDVVYTSSQDSSKRAVPFAHKELKKSLEVIASTPEPERKSYLLENMFSDKARTLKASVNALLEEIGLREDLNASHFGKIDGEVSRLHSELMNLENVTESHPFDLAGAVDEERTRIRADVFELERERRQEGLECWRDLMFLKKYLMGSLKDYWELVRRQEALGK